MASPRFLALVAVLLLLPALPPPALAQSSDEIIIVGDADLASKAKRGIGTPNNPYILEFPAITPDNRTGIDISNTRASFILRNASVIAGGSRDAIRFSNVTNGVIENADLQFNAIGIRLQEANGTIVRNSTVRASQVGILLEGTSAANVTGNSLAVNDQDVAFRSLTGQRGLVLHARGNTFRENNLSIATGQIGFAFQDVAQYDNDINASNVVNFVPVRWHTRLAGTAAAPAVIEGEAVHVKGVTNVGQVVCYACSHVHIRNVSASSGSVSGLRVELSQNVTITGALAEGNEAAGVQVLNSSNVRVEGSSAYGNAVGFHASNATNLMLATSIANANRQGVVVATGANNTLRENTLERNVDGALLDATIRARTENNTFARNTGDGLRVSRGADHVLRNETALENGGAGFALTGTRNVTVNDSRAEGNAKGGIVLSGGTLLSRVTRNVATANGDGGIWLTAVGAQNRVEDNALSGQARHIRLTSTEQNVIERNNMTSGPGETGIWFDDETSYNNAVGTSNLVDGTPVQWHVALVGSSTQPIVLRSLRAETPNMTNVAQIMIFKGSYVQIVDAAASGGARGIFALRSSSITIADATLRDNEAGIELRGTQTGEVRRVTASGGRVGVLLTDTLNVSVSDVAAPGARVAVEFSDTRSRGSVVERVNANATREASVKDPSASTSTPRHLIADAGLDKLAAAGENVSFSDAIGVARFGSERIVRQTWDFGDGERAETTEGPTLRPVHVYATGGNRTATYAIETADGLVLTDTVKVRVIGPPPPPEPLEAEADRLTVTLRWAVPESEFPVTGFRLYRGLDPASMTLFENLTTNETVVDEDVTRRTQVYYAVTAIGRGGESAMPEPTRVLVQPPPPPPPAATPTVTPELEEPAATPLPGAGLLVVALGGAALALRRRRRC